MAEQAKIDDSAMNRARAAFVECSKRTSDLSIILKAAIEAALGEPIEETAGGISRPLMDVSRAFINQVALEIELEDQGRVEGAAASQNAFREGAPE